MRNKYTTNYFIKLFKSIPARRWTTGTMHNPLTDQRCALGHCMKIDVESEIVDLFKKAGLNVVDVNDGLGIQKTFPQKTPRARILAALRYIKNI